MREPWNKAGHAEGTVEQGIVLISIGLNRLISEQEPVKSEGGHEPVEQINAKCEKHISDMESYIDYLPPLLRR